MPKEERIEFPENENNICYELILSKCDWQKGTPLEIELESSDYYSSGTFRYCLTKEQITELKKFLNDNF